MSLFVLSLLLISQSIGLLSLFLSGLVPGVGYYHCLINFYLLCVCLCMCRHVLHDSQPVFILLHSPAGCVVDEMLYVFLVKPVRSANPSGSNYETVA